MNEILEFLSSQLTTMNWIAPIFALLAGVVTSFTPCSLSSISLIIGYVGGVKEKNSKKAFWLSLTFAIGTAVTFTIFGIIAALAGRLIGVTSQWWYMILGILMVLMTLQIWEVIELIPSTYLVSKNKKKGFLGAFLTGVLAGIFSSPCSTPVLITLLAVVATNGNIVWGILLLLCYSLGHATLAIIVGTSMGFVQKLSQNSIYGKLSKFIKLVTGLVVLVLALYMFYLGF